MKSCAYCFAAIKGEVHTVRGRDYHPPRMLGGRAHGGCAEMDAPLVADQKPPRVNADQLKLA